MTHRKRKLLAAYLDDEHIGTATFNKAKNGYMVVYTDYVHYADRFVPLEEFETYKANLKLNSMSGKQVTLEDLL